MHRDTAADAAAARRAARALELRLAGATYRDIAEALDIAVSTAHADVAHALADIPRAEADALRALECRRLDALQAACWGPALDGDLAAVDRVLRIIDRRARLLGLDAPTRLDVSPGDVDLDGTVVRILALAGTAAPALGD